MIFKWFICRFWDDFNMQNRNWIRVTGSLHWPPQFRDDSNNDLLSEICARKTVMASIFFWIVGESLKQLCLTIQLWFNFCMIHLPKINLRIMHESECESALNRALWLSLLTSFYFSFLCRLQQPLDSQEQSSDCGGYKSTSGGQPHQDQSHIRCLLVHLWISQWDWSQRDILVTSTSRVE